MLWLHSSIGYVLQTPHLFSGSVRDNIRYGRLDATDEEIEAAAKLVSAHDAIMHMENGYDSDVGEGGDQLSTGEKAAHLVCKSRAGRPAHLRLRQKPPRPSIPKPRSSFSTPFRRCLKTEPRSSLRTASTIRHADLILVVRARQDYRAGHARRAASKQKATTPISTTNSSSRKT